MNRFDGRATRQRSGVSYLGNKEPTIEELLTDPIAALLRRRAGLSLEDIYRCIAKVVARTRFRRAG